MRCVRNDLPHDITDLCKLVHEVDPVMETACSIDEHDVSILGDSRLYSIKSHRSRIRTHILLYDIDTCTLCPDCKLVHCSGTECIRSTDYHLFALSLKLACELADSCGLSYSIHTDYHDDIWFLREVKRLHDVIGSLTLLYIEKGRDLVTKDINEFIKRDILIPAHSLLEILDDLEGGVHSHICCHKSLLNRIKQVIVNLCLAYDRMGKPLEEAHVGLFYAFIKNAHKT